MVKQLSLHEHVKPVVKTEGLSGVGLRRGRYFFDHDTGQEVVVFWFRHTYTSWLTWT